MNHSGSDIEPWMGETNPLGCCRYNVTEGGIHTHGGSDCVWPNGIGKEPTA